VRRILTIGIALFVLVPYGVVEARRRTDTSNLNPVGRPEGKGKALRCEVFYEAGTRKSCADGARGERRHTIKGSVTVGDGKNVPGGLG
jgi:hypothetical protein